MKLSVRRVLFLLAVGAAVTVFSLAVLPGSSRSGLYASTLEDSQEVMGGGNSCPKVRCVTACWLDGCVSNKPNRTFCRRTIIQPIECEPGTGGCVTSAC